MSRLRLIAVVALVASPLACVSTKDSVAGGDRSQKAATAQASPPPSSSEVKPVEPPPGALTHDVLAWESAPTWTPVPSTSPVRRGTYRVPRAEGDPEDGEVTIVAYGRGQGGSASTVADRWVGQFAPEEAIRVTRSEGMVLGMHVLRADVSGVYAGAGVLGGPDGVRKPGWALLGAVIETPAGPYIFRFVGPAKTVMARRDGFERMLSGLKPAG